MTDRVTLKPTTNIIVRSFPMFTRRAGSTRNPHPSTTSWSWDWALRDLSLPSALVPWAVRWPRLSTAWAAA